ncbi:hypothetical protein ABPG74_000390 [Tetrahymena malaccensis]
MNQQQDQQQQQIQQQQQNGVVTKQRYMDLYAMIFIVIILIVSGILIYVANEKTYIVAEEIKSNNHENHAEDIKEVNQFYIRIQKLLNSKNVQEKIIKDLKYNSQILFDIYDLNGDGIVENEEYIFPMFQKSFMNKQDFIKYINENPKQLIFKFEEPQSKKSQDLKKQFAFINSKQANDKDEKYQFDNQSQNQFFYKLIKNQKKYEFYMEWLFNILDGDQNNQLDLQELESDLQFNYQKYTSITKEQWTQITNNTQQIITKQKDNSKQQKYSKSINQNLVIFFDILNKIHLI